MKYYSLNRYLREHFGRKLYKLSLNTGMGCPNRDGTVGVGGCIFCSRGGSGEFAADPNLNVTEQIEQAKKRVSKKFRGSKYIAYFQAGTNTYAPPDLLEKLFSQAVLHPDIEVVSIATRPDCLPDDVLGILEKLNRIKPVWVELGLQTIHEETARMINRCYSLDVYDRAVENLHKAGLNVITHVILGLPGESREQMIKTVEYVGRDTDGIKLQLLHVLKGTKLEQMYLEGTVKVMTMDEYISLLHDCLSVLPENVVVHRLTGDGDKRLLVAPMWSADKKRVLNAIRKSGICDENSNMTK